MKGIIQFNLARRSIEHPFIGLPHVSGKLIQLLITRADPSSGIVENLSYRDLANLLMVEHAPGRKGAGTPKQETIRSYLRTVSKSCPDDFRLISQGQKLKCQFINMPKIYAYFCANNEVYRVEEVVLTTTRSQAETALVSDDDLFLGTYENEDLSRESLVAMPVKNINIINNNNNKITTKAPITDNFTPSHETIARAMASGYSNATDFNVIQEFIDKNRAWGSQFADFQPIYLMFLAKHRERKQQQKQHTKSGSIPHATSSSSFKTRQPSARERVKQAHANNFIFSETTGRYSARNPHATGTHCHTMAATY